MLLRPAGDDVNVELAELMAAMARVEEGVTGCRSDIRRNHDVSVKRLDSHGKRVASLERTRAKLVGAMSVISLAVGSMVGWLGLGR